MQEQLAIQVQPVPEGAADQKFNKSVQGDSNDADLAELISDCESPSIKQRVASDDLGEQNVDGNYGDSCRSQSGSKRSSSSPSPELSLDDVSLSDDEEQDKVSQNSNQDQE